VLWALHKMMKSCHIEPSSSKGMRDTAQQSGSTQMTYLAIFAQEIARQVSWARNRRRESEPVVVQAVWRHLQVAFLSATELGSHLLY
jgi:pyocin large subunit-like protein